MKLQVRNKNGNMFAQYKDEWAVEQFAKLMQDKECFRFTTKTFTDAPEVQVPVFVCLKHCKLTITYNFELRLEPDDYIQVIE